MPGRMNRRWSGSLLCPHVSMWRPGRRRRRAHPFMRRDRFSSWAVSAGATRSGQSDTDGPFAPQDAVWRSGEPKAAGQPRTKNWGVVEAEPAEDSHVSLAGRIVQSRVDRFDRGWLPADALSVETLSRTPSPHAWLPFGPCDSHGRGSRSAALLTLLTPNCRPLRQNEVSGVPTDEGR
jgi:hypothetical protein